MELEPSYALLLGGGRLAHGTYSCEVVLEPDLAKPVTQAAP